MGIKYSFNQKLIFMGSEKIFMFGEPGCGCGGGSKADLTAILPALMNNNKGIAPRTVMTGTIVTMTSLKCVVVEEDGECDGKGSLLFQ